MIGRRPREEMSGPQSPPSPGRRTHRGGVMKRFLAAATLSMATLMSGNAAGVGPAAGSSAAPGLGSATAEKTIRFRVGLDHRPLIVPGNPSREETAALTILLLNCPPGEDPDSCPPARGGRVTLDFLNAASLAFVTVDPVRRTGEIFTTTIRVRAPSGGTGTGADAIELRIRAYVDDGEEAAADGIATIPLDFRGVRGTIANPAPGHAPAPRQPWAPPPPGPTAHTEAPTAHSNLPYFVVQEAGSSTPVVMAGSRGLKPGDRVLGTYGTLDDATRALQRHARGGPSLPGAVAADVVSVPVAASAVSDPPPTPAPTPAPARAAAPSSGVAQLVLSSAVVSIGPARCLIIDSRGSRTWILEAAGGTPERARLRPVPEPFAGSPMKQPMTLSAVLRGGRIVDGLLAFRNRLGDAFFFDGADRQPAAWERRHITFQSQIRVEPGSVLLLPREDVGGATTGVYIYHYPSSTTLYCRGFRHSLQQAPSRRVEGLPRFSAPPSVVPVLRRGGATRSYVFLDGVGGTVWCLLNVRPHPLTPRPQRTRLDLRNALGIPAGKRARLAARPMVALDRSSSTALLCEGTTGKIAILRRTDRPDAMEVQVLAGSLGALPGGREVPLDPVLLPLGHASKFWLLDRISGHLAIVDVDEGAGRATVRAVQVESP